MQRIIKESDTFQLLVKENIDSQDYQYLFMLYQPIIGIQATNLYLTLLQEKHLTDRINLDFNHKRLMVLLDINSIELLEAFKILEAYQLLVSYYYPSKATYIYHIKKPMNAPNFFADEKLAEKLIAQIGTLQFERQKYYFSKYQPAITQDFINITENEIIVNQEVQTTNKINLQELMTNLNKAQAKLPEINPIIKSTSNFAQLKANLETPLTVNINNIANKDILNQISSMQVKTPEEYLISLTEKPLDTKLKNILHQLTFNYHLNPEVINCLIEYVWFKNNQRIEPNYILKIAKTFNEKAIDNVSDAVNHLKLAFQKGKKNPYSTKKYQQDVLWTNDNYEFDLKKPKSTNAENLMSEKEITKILEEFDNF
ncbi:DnaD domain protein [Spiroplasma platyhelix]|uniref:Chromosome replication initiation and membrane attachment protein n=1 Tax=Spiroplasma platyhelix PALS-1 TaxID=1276218 RepID=A0A846TWN3_9MOLU|nr:DnaD domain protein [Spiroplasma platyhelix]MBE4704071.1 hypothetical protein [Spiroplasma platyhelix PALS-1]NKE38441.1 hypothetical protein [Spiroplasma platyhelix PALS-1]UJB29329.1 replication initiation and membrane attachment protein [Spiroplasma platyhelix PALS-1]